MSVWPEARGRNGDRAEAAKRPPLRDAIPDLFSVRIISAFAPFSRGRAA